MNRLQTVELNGSAGGCTHPAWAEASGDIGGAAIMPHALLTPCGGGDAIGEPLDLIEEHLTFNPTLPSAFDYHKPHQGGRLIENWSFPDGFKVDGELTPVLKIQPFASGGYEATIRLMDIEKIGNAMDAPRRFGKREAPEVQDFGCVQKAASRAKRKVRHLVKNMGATNLVTLTRRESPGTGYWTPEQWAKAWDRLRRNIEKVVGDFPYVGVLEAHKKGNFHLHLAWLGKVNLNLIRPLWWAICGGRGAGNVDSQYIKVRAGLERADRVAKYISKYTSKHFEDSGRFNKKRYWASRQTMQEAKRYVLKSKTVEEGFNEALRFLGLDLGMFMVNHPTKGYIADHVFYFPDGGGVWLNYIPDIHSSTEIPF
jgi:hypothetical protein